MQSIHSCILTLTHTEILNLCIRVCIHAKHEYVRPSIRVCRCIRWHRRGMVCSRTIRCFIIWPARVGDNSVYVSVRVCARVCLCLRACGCVFGHASAFRLAAAGAKVIVTGRRTDKLESVAARIRKVC